MPSSNLNTPSATLPRCLRVLHVSVLLLVAAAIGNCSNTEAPSNPPDSSIASSGGASATGGASASGGMATTGGATSTGGTVLTGGVATTGGVSSNGGSTSGGSSVKTDASPTSTGGSVTGGASASGGSGQTGDTTSTGGASSTNASTSNRDASPNPDVGADTGGVPKTGGTTGSGGDTGGVPKTGGTTDTGGATRTGGSTSTGGAMNTGGATGTGGATRAGGSTSTGGTTGTGGNTGGGGGTTASCTAVPVAPNATQQTRNVLCYLHNIYGTGILSGQEEDNNDNGMNTVFAATGKYPAIRAFDVNNSQAPTQCVTHWNNGGICMFGYHMGINGGTYSTKTNIDNVLAAGTAENTSFNADLDRIAQFVTPLKTAGGVAILRLFHEAGNGCAWFLVVHGDFGAVAESFQVRVQLPDGHQGAQQCSVPSAPLSVPTAAYNPGAQYIDFGGADNYVKAGTRNR